MDFENIKYINFKNILFLVYVHVWAHLLLLIFNENLHIFCISYL